jgi:hypothetical protein
MTSEDIKIVIAWLRRREHVCTSDLIRQFIKFENDDEVKGAQKLYKLLLYEAGVEEKHPS